MTDLACGIVALLIIMAVFTIVATVLTESWWLIILCVVGGFIGWAWDQFFKADKEEE